MFGLFKRKEKRREEPAQGYDWGFFETADGPEIAYRDYPGDAGRAPALCLHGLTRNSRDFEELAPMIVAATGRRVIVPEMRGRGRSDPDPDASRYQPATYAADVDGLLTALGISEAVWIGTSMGGLLAMIAAASTPGRVRAAVLNDVGPELDPVGLARIQGYVGDTAPTRSWEAAADRARKINELAFPDRDDAFWMTFARKTHRETSRGVELDYDPAISGNVKQGEAAPPDMWPLFEALKDIPTLVVRGELSDILAASTLEKMRDIKPDLKVARVERIGHAPYMTEPEAWRAIEDFLKSLDG